MIIAEESSRLYRHHTKAGELFESAVDAGVRVICPSDSIDTADHDWPDRLNMCQTQHARSNFCTRQQIRRAHDGLWARGAAVGNTKFGYKRRPTVPAKVEKRQLLDGPIRVILYMRIDGKRVVPRLEFAINLVAALPPAVAGPLRQAAGDEAEDEPVAMLKRTLMVNPEAAGLPEPYRRLTEKPDHVPQWCSKHWLQAGERKGGGRSRRAS